MIKKEIRVLGVSCTTPPRGSGIPIQVVGVVYRGNRWLEGVMRTTIPSTVVDLTSRIARMVIHSPHFPQLRVIALNELITRSGTYADIKGLSRMTGLPVIAVLRRKPAVRHLSVTTRKGSSRERNAFARLTYRRWEAGRRRFYVYSAGSDKMPLSEILVVSAAKEGPPEAARVARIVASSLDRLLARQRAWPERRHPSAQS